MDPDGAADPDADAEGDPDVVAGPDVDGCAEPEAGAVASRDADSCGRTTGAAVVAGRSNFHPALSNCGITIFKAATVRSGGGRPQASRPRKANEETNSFGR